MDETEEEILESAYRVLNKEGYSNLSIRKIAEEAGKDKSLIYHHYDSKDDLIKALIDHVGEVVRHETEKILEKEEDRLEHLTEFYLGIGKNEHPDVDRSVLELKTLASRSPEMAGKLGEIDSDMEEVVSEVLEELGYSDPGYKAKIFIDMVHGSMSRKLATRDKEGLKDSKQRIIDTMKQLE